MLLPLEAWHRVMVRALESGRIVLSIDELLRDEEDVESEMDYDTHDEESTLSCEEVDYEGSWANPIDLTLEEED